MSAEQLRKSLQEPDGQSGLCPSVKVPAREVEWKVDQHNRDTDHTVRRKAEFELARCFTLDECAAKLREVFKGWFVYRGGHHIALHRDSGIASARVLLLVEA